MNPSTKRTRAFDAAQKALVVAVYLSVALCSAAAHACAESREDILIADFEGETFGSWKTTGTAFGSGPARGTLTGQMAVSGFQGKGLVNSFHGGDGSTGTLSSPPFEIMRPYLNFLIGGGKFPGQTCMELLLEDKPVRTATGPNDRPGGSENLDWSSWDVTGLLGKTVTLRITDTHQGGWGHVSVDHIVQSDTNRGLETITRRIVLERRFFHLPVKRDAPLRPVKYIWGGHNLSVFEIRLPQAGQDPDFWVFIEEPRAKGLTFFFDSSLPAGSKALETITQSDDPPGRKDVPRERPAAIPLHLPPRLAQ